ncbi:MAG: tyrosine-type recombinase/integrase [Rhodospirillaceae bacterium]|nr:tyrosine-type recombinase/integrase [Rhodospirillaceae bacterium]MYB12983.1 tyrosine-type recombinase/integrase [Rhodospirillaceae bacterium]MYI49376.1 tyrosine-type recombinase/integrase [Rhodospirillaceae bacterium]
MARRPPGGGRRACRHRRPAPCLAGDALPGQPDGPDLSRLFTLAEVWGLRPDGSNPCRHVRRFREEKCERFLSDAEYARLGAALKAGEAQGLEPPEVIAAIRLLMLTGCRRSEILTLHWDHVDLEAGDLRLPDSKTGAKTVHLGDPAIAVLRAIPRRDGDPFVIAGSAPGRPMKDLHHYWQRIRRRAGLEGVRIHDLRHPYASSGLLVGEVIGVHIESDCIVDGRVDFARLDPIGRLGYTDYVRVDNTFEMILKEIYVLTRPDAGPPKT